MLIGSDILSGGRVSGQFNYTGLKLDTDAQGVVTGHICFERNGQVVEEQLVNVPTCQGSQSTGTTTVGWVAGGPGGAQGIRRFA
jgi:hypothetical protein